MVDAAPVGRPAEGRRVGWAGSDNCSGSERWRRQWPVQSECQCQGRVPVRSVASRRRPVGGGSGASTRGRRHAPAAARTLTSAGPWADRPERRQRQLQRRRWGCVDGQLGLLAGGGG
eukprot:TRINITY_DN19673_c0_g1_i1.p2 TRINITY_DN19673_c0_g1~~TRINITY_DN19673_c0_g1_i1.p2  ORF type:complete len:117 (+),score=10.71 TRINITY_DN19673_c0_g1_i1:89-439(+)